MYRIACFAMLLCVCLGAFSQNTITGKITDESGNGLPGATISVSPGNGGAVSNTDGEFQVTVEKGTYTLAFSYLGYKRQEINVTIPYTEEALHIALKPQSILTEEVVVKSSRADKNSPVTYTNVSAKEIKQFYVGQDVPMVLERATPSIISYSESGSGFSNYSSFTLRGIDQSRINITLNGVPLNDMIDQGVFFSNFTDFSNNVESVQVQRGVGTSANGTASYAGSVSFESPYLFQDSASANVQLVAGSFNTLRGSIGIKTGVQENRTAFYTRFTTFQSDGYRYNTGTVSKSFYGSAAYFGDRDLLKLNMFIGRSQNGLGYYPVAKSDIEKDPQTNYNNENDKDDFGQWLLHLQHTHRFNRNLNLATSVYYQGAGGDYLYSWVEDGSLLQINYPLRNDHIGIMTNASYVSDDNAIHLDGGIHLYSFYRKNWEQTMPDKANPYYTETSQKNEISAFAKGSYKLGYFTFFGDVQLRQVQLLIDPDDSFVLSDSTLVKEWTFFNPKVGVTLQITDDVSLYTSYGRTNREPTKVDLLGGFQLKTDNLPYVVGDSITFEKVDDIELGVKAKSSIMSGSVNLFYMKFTNELAPIGALVDEGWLQLRKNMPESRRAGVEAEFTANPVSNLTVAGNVTYMNSVIKEYAPEYDTVYTNVRPALTPEIMGGGNVTYKFGDIASLGFSGKYVGESYLEPTNNEAYTLPQYVVMDFHATLFYQDKVQLDLYVNNIFDKQYFTYGLPVDSDGDWMNDQPGYHVNPPRNFYVKLTLNF